LDELSECKDESQFVHDSELLDEQYEPDPSLHDSELLDEQLSVSQLDSLEHSDISGIGVIGKLCPHPINQFCVLHGFIYVLTLFIV